MFNLGSSELILILLVAFIIVGPKDLPKVGRAIGRWVRQLREMFNEFKEETGLDETLEDLKDTNREVNTLIRESDPRMELKDAVSEARKAVDEAKHDVKDGLPGHKK
jgi:sec-independent protein translocase protein TatB